MKEKRPDDNRKDEGLILLVDKPVGWSSFDVVKKLRGIYRTRKIGHAGTLDPGATGLLIVCTGQKTKMLNEFVESQKEYVGTMELGVRTPSFDRETEVVERQRIDHITPTEITSTAATLTGVQKQLPPMYSALKYAGKPLYKYARKGKEVPRQEREVEIFAFDISDVQMPFVHFRIVCSKGTYIRAIAEEFGRRLGCGAILSDLRRTRIGEFHVDNAQSIDELAMAPLASKAG